MRSYGRIRSIRRGFRLALRAEKTLDLRDHLVRPARLDQDAVAACEWLGRQIVGCEDDHRNVTGLLGVFQSTGDFPAVDVGKRKVHEDNVGTETHGFVESFTAIAG